MLNCFETGIRMCNESTREEFESANNITYYTLYDCQNIEIIEEFPITFNNDGNISITTESETITTNEEINDTDIQQIDDIKLIIQNQPMMRFNFTKTELREKCNEKGNDSLKSVLDLYTDYLTIHADKQYLIRNLKEKDKLLSMIEENCYKAEDIRNNFNNMLNSIEECLDEDDRLEDENKEILLNKSIEKFCSDLENRKT